MSYAIPRDPGLKRRKRVGRGESSGWGKTAGRGQKGQRARAGRDIKPWFEGGQMPLIRRLPKLHGFKPPKRKEYQVVNLDRLRRFVPEDVKEVTPEVLESLRLVRDAEKPIKILGKGKLGRPLKVIADAFSRTARQRIEEAGGEAVTR